MDMNRRSFVSSSAAFAATPFLASSSSLGAQYGEFGDFKKKFKVSDDLQD
jgi:hypothetical protein